MLVVNWEFGLVCLNYCNTKTFIISCIIFPFCLASWKPYKSGVDSTAGTTATVAILFPGQIYVGNVGDSSAIMEMEDRIALLTKTHVVGNNESEDESVRKRGNFCLNYIVHVSSCTCSHVPVIVHIYPLCVCM